MNGTGMSYEIMISFKQCSNKGIPWPFLRLIENNKHSYISIRNLTNTFNHCFNGLLCHPTNEMWNAHIADAVLDAVLDASTSNSSVSEQFYVNTPGVKGTQMLKQWTTIPLNQHKRIHNFIHWRLCLMYCLNACNFRTHTHSERSNSNGKETTKCGEWHTSISKHTTDRPSDIKTKSYFPLCTAKL